MQELFFIRIQIDYVNMFTHKTCDSDNFPSCNTLLFKQSPLSKLDVVEAVEGISSCFDFKSFFISTQI